MPIEGELVEF